MERIAVDNLIIGSGFAGAVAALRLGEASHKHPDKVGSVAVVERGRRWKDPSELPPMLTTSKAQRWRTRQHPLSPLLPRTPKSERNYPGLLERFSEPGGADVVCGAALGGGSVVYGGMMVKPEPGDFELIFGKGRLGGELDAEGLAKLDLDSASMERYYRRVRDEMAQSRDPMTGDELNPGWRPGEFGHISDVRSSLSADGLAAYKQRFAARIRLRKDAIASGRRKKLRKMGTAVNWQVIRDELEGKVTAAATAGEAVMGFRSGAMMSLDKNYLWRAEKDYGVKVHTTAIVERMIWYPGSETHLVVCKQIGEDGEGDTRFAFEAKRVFMCAGSMNSSRLLLDAKARGNLGQMSDAVGRDWGGNGDELLRRRARRKTGFDFFDALEEDQQPDAKPPFDDPEFVRDLKIKTMGRWRQASPPTVALYERKGDEPLRLIHTAGTAVNSHEIPHLAMSIPQRLGRLRLGSKQALIIDWGRDVARDQKRRARKELRAMALGLKGKSKLLPALPGKATYHPLGGMRLGKACDWYGRVRGAKALYVLDGSLLPGHAAACNPAWTIAALAERCIETLIREDLS